MIDSTNAEVPGFIPSEDIMPVLDSVFAKARGRVIVASFASRVHRIQQIIDMAVEQAEDCLRRSVHGAQYAHRQ